MRGPLYTCLVELCFNIESDVLARVKKSMLISSKVVNLDYKDTLFNIEIDTSPSDIKQDISKERHDWG